MFNFLIRAISCYLGPNKQTASVVSPLTKDKTSEEFGFGDLVEEESCNIVSNKKSTVDIKKTISVIAHTQTLSEQSTPSTAYTA